MKRNTLMILFIFFLALALFYSPAGCTPVPEPDEEPVEEPVDEPEPEDPEPEEPEPEEPEPEDPGAAASYFWPWISHGQLVLSSSEIIDGPKLLESEPGFIGEFTEGTVYNGRVTWEVESTDVFEIEWLTLNFEVDYYEQYEWQFDLNFFFEIDGLEPVPMAKGVQYFAVDLAEEQEGFRVEIERVILGKEQEGEFSPEPIDFVALEMEIAVVDKP